jgi:hypothetical protein
MRDAYDRHGHPIDVEDPSVRLPALPQEITPWQVLGGLALVGGALAG